SEKQRSIVAVAVEIVDLVYLGVTGNVENHDGTRELGPSWDLAPALAYLRRVRRYLPFVNRCTSRSEKHRKTMAIWHAFSPLARP
ncbi:MAG: hypothetical protein ACK4MT_06555, partial [Thermaurantiacus tibetensis]